MTESEESQEDEDFDGEPDEAIVLPEPESIPPEIELLEDVTQL